MAPISFLVTGLVVMLVVATPAAEALLEGILGMPNLVQIQGIVPCSQNISAAINGSLTPVFPNAQVQLTCGGNIIATTTTNADGKFSIDLNSVQFLLPELLRNCHLAVLTPLSDCNPALPAMGVLRSTLQFTENIITEPLHIITIIAAGFEFSTV